MLINAEQITWQLVAAGIHSKQTEAFTSALAAVLDAYDLEVQRRKAESQSRILTRILLAIFGLQALLLLELMLH